MADFEDFWAAPSRSRPRRPIGMSVRRLEISCFGNRDLRNLLRCVGVFQEDGNAVRIRLALQSAYDKAVIIPVVAVLNREARGRIFAEEGVEDDGGLLFGVDILFVEDTDFHGAIEEQRELRGIPRRKSIFDFSVRLREGKR